MMKSFSKTLLVLSLFFLDKIYSQEIAGEQFRILPTTVDSASNQVLIYLDSIPENIFYPHTIYWDTDRWIMKLEIDNSFSNRNVKAAITNNGILFFILPEIATSKFLIFSDGKWKESTSLSIH